MKIKSVQKIIRVGDSLGVTIPYQDVRRSGLKPGDEIQISFVSRQKPKKSMQNLVREYEDFKSKYGSTLKSLAKR